ncbi:hypothetical protein [Vibrio campbellii]|uniref:hypothetical protein n=1 Tax=Vibrio campbellii TaxID=680 RepID=UPI00168D1CB6|nr:hypothetical protein [Vibrio campbellii]
MKVLKSINASLILLFCIVGKVNASGHNEFQICIKGDPQLKSASLNYQLDSINREFNVVGKQYNELTCGDRHSMHFSHAKDEISTKFSLINEEGTLATDSVKFTIDTAGGSNNIWINSPELCREKVQIYVNLEGKEVALCEEPTDKDSVEFPDGELIKIVYNVPKKETILSNTVDTCSSTNNSTCIIGGENNSSRFKLIDSSPSNSFEDQSVSVSKSESMSFSIGGNAGGEFDGGLSLTAGLNIDFSTATEKSSSMDLLAFYVENHSLRNDVGHTIRYRTSKNAVDAALDQANVDQNGLITNADEVLGSKLWRELDLSTTTSWQEVVDETNCKNQNIAFINHLELARSEELIPGNSEVSDPYVRKYYFNDVLEINTTCVFDKPTGNYYRIKSESLLD